MIAAPVGADHDRKTGGRRRRNGRLFAAAAIVGSSSVGIAVALLGSVIAHAKIRGPLTGATWIIALVYAVGELVKKPLPVPTFRWQVPRRWSLYGDGAFSAIFGLCLGAGFLTVVPFVGYYLLISWCFLSQSAVQAGVVMAIFGVMRGAPLMLVAEGTAIACRPASSRGSMAVVRGFGNVHPGLRVARGATLLAFAVAAALAQK
jgi:hypothetical protein